MARKHNCVQTSKHTHQQASKQASRQARKHRLIEANQHSKSRNTPKNFAFARTVSKSSHELLPAFLRHESEIQQNCSEELAQTIVSFWVDFLRVDSPPHTSIGAKKSTQTFFVQSFSTTLRVMDVRAENRGRPHQKVRFSAAPVMGRNFLTPGHPGVRVRNVRGKSGPKSLCLCCFSSLKSRQAYKQGSKQADM